MRIAPIGTLFSTTQKEELCRYVAAVSSVTHTSDITLAGASMIAMAVASALEYHDREKMIEDALSVEEYAMNLGASTPSPSLGARTKLGILLAQTYANDETAFLENIYNVIGAGVNTSESVPAALAIAYYSFDVRKCALLCANLGGDTDTIGAMAAAICGAAQGLSEIPEKDIALILDEVQCGMGRTGTIMTYFQYDILPDILCLAKGIGAGFPMGAFVANKKFAAAMEPGDHGSTYGGNPMAGQACRTVFKILEETKMLDHVQDISEYLIEKLDDLKDNYSCINERRGLGLMIGLEFDGQVKDIVQNCLDNGLIVVMAGANVIRMLPPFITTEKDVDQAIAILDQAIEKNI